MISSDYQREVVDVSVKVSNVLRDIDWAIAMTALAHVAASTINNRKLNADGVDFAAKCFVRKFSELVGAAPPHTGSML
jgi:hypothetical protein